MNTHRTVAWLAIFMIITPFLAIPEWLMQAILAALGIAIVCTAWMTRPDTTQPSSQNDSSADSGTGDRSMPDRQNRNSEPKERTQDPQQPLDIEDPEADTMVAADRWRRRASRDIT